MNEIRKMIAVLAISVLSAIQCVPVLAANQSVASSRNAQYAAKNESALSLRQIRAAQWHIVGNEYVTVASNDHGIGSDVVISIDQQGYNGWEYQMNIIMTDIRGNVVWRADNVTGVAADGHWWAGYNVAKVQLQIAPRRWGIPERKFRVRCSS